MAVIKVYELKIALYLLECITFEDLNLEINKLIDKSFIHDKEMNKFHSENKFKNYTFNSLYPIEKDKIYKKGNIYNLIIRTMDKGLEEHFKRYLTNEYTNKLKVLTTESKIIINKHIEKIYSITPIVMKFDNGYWKTNNGIDIFEKRLRENLIKKYNKFYNEKLNENFELFRYVKIENSKPIPIKYKNILLLGDKVTIEIAENETAQKLAYIAIGSSLGEMGSRGMGFCNYKYI